MHSHAEHGNEENKKKLSKAFYGQNITNARTATRTQ